MRCGAPPKISRDILTKHRPMEYETNSVRYIFAINRERYVKPILREAFGRKCIPLS